MVNPAKTPILTLDSMLGTDNAAAKAAGFDEYDQLIEDAHKETKDVNKRYEKYAAAQAWLTDSALLIPIHSDGASPVVKKKRGVLQS